MKNKIVLAHKCDTVGDLLDKLAEIAKDKNLWDVMGSAIESTSDVFTGFTITEATLSDKSKVLNFEFTQA